MTKGHIYYYARIMPSVSIYEVCEIKVRSVYDTYFVGVDKRDKHSYLFTPDDAGKILFEDRRTALDIVLEAEKNKKTVSNETYYEEY